MVIGRRVFVGRSARTNDAGIGQLRTIVERHGGAVVVVEVAHCLHLKTAVTALSADTLLAHRPALAAAFDGGTFAGFRVVDADAAAANALRVGERVWLSKGHPRTHERIVDAGFSVQELDITELAKAEAGLTCLSVLLP
jgi:dimethylargininase